MQYLMASFPWPWEKQLVLSSRTQSQRLAQLRGGGWGLNPNQIDSKRSRSLSAGPAVRQAKHVPNSLYPCLAAWAWASLPVNPWEMDGVIVPGALMRSPRL